LRPAFSQQILTYCAVGAANAGDLGGNGLGAFEAVEPAYLADAPFTKIIKDGPDQDYECDL
jgi:hypothetical protein